MTTNRWISACHEAGHGIASLVLGGKCLGLALYDGGQSGQASIDELLPDRLAYAIASGPAAERLAEEYLAPNCTPAESRTLTVDEIESLPVRRTAPSLAAQLARTEADRKGYPCDDRLIAIWAIEGHEDQPEVWAGRVAHAHRIAADIITENAAAIVRVASALFKTNSLSGPEVTALLERPKP